MRLRFLSQRNREIGKEKVWCLSAMSQELWILCRFDHVGLGCQRYKTSGFLEKGWLSSCCTAEALALPISLQPVFDRLNLARSSRQLHGSIVSATMDYSNCSLARHPLCHPSNDKAHHQLRTETHQVSHKTKTLGLCWSSVSYKPKVSFCWPTTSVLELNTALSYLASLQFGIQLHCTFRRLSLYQHSLQPKVFSGSTWLKMSFHRICEHHLSFRMIFSTIH